MNDLLTIVYASVVVLVVAPLGIAVGVWQRRKSRHRQNNPRATVVRRDVLEQHQS